MVEVLHAEIRAEATGGETIDRVRRETEKLEHELAKLHHEEHEGAGALARFAEAMAFAGERSEGLRDHAFELRAALGESGETVGELVPMLGALGAAASVTGLVDMARETAEARTQLNAMAETLGTSVAQLQAYRLGAQETDVPIEAMQAGILKLDRAMANAASGKAKDVASIFQHMGISLYDAHHHLRSTDQVLPLIAESLAHTEDATLRNAVAMQLFGRGGAELIPFLKLGRQGLEDLAHASQRLNATYSSEDNENVEAFKNSWIELDTAVGGLKDTITADLAPILTPVIHQMTDWIAANRTWIGQDIAEKFDEVSTALKSVDWARVAHDAEAVGHVLGEGARLVGGWDRLAEIIVGLALLKFAWSAAQPLIEMGKIGVEATKLGVLLTRELAEKWGLVGKAAGEAAAAEEAAAHVAVPGAKAAAGAEKAAEEASGITARGKNLIKALPLVPLAYELAVDGPPLLDMLAHSDGSPVVRANARGVTGPGHDATHMVSGPRGRNSSRGAPSSGFDPFDALIDLIEGLHHVRGPSATVADGARDGEVKVSVQLTGVPPGTTVTTSQSGAARVDTVDVGHNHPMGYPTPR